MGESMFTSFIDVKAWDAARWKGAAFGYRLQGDPTPFVGLYFLNPAAGRQVFEGLRSWVGAVDGFEEIRVSIIEGDIPGQDPGYTVHIGAEPQNVLARLRSEGKEVDPSSILTVSRLHRMNPEPGSPYLPAFKQKFAEIGKYHLLPFIERGRGPSPDFGLAIEKRVIHLRRADEIVPGDLDSVALDVKWPAE